MATPPVRLGTITFGVADVDGDEFHVADIVGWTGVPVELATVEKPISAGAVIAFNRQRARALTVVGTGIAGGDGDVFRVRTKLEAAVAAMVTSDANLEVDEPAGTKRLVVRSAGDPRVRPLGDIAIQFEVSLFAADPAKTSVP